MVFRSLLVAVPTALIACAGCASDDKGSVPSASVVDPSPGGLRNCTTASGISFDTALASCDEAIDRGLTLAFAGGLITSVDAPGADIGFSALCVILQGSSMKTYEIDANKSVAVQLSESGVCPGDPDLLVKP